VKQLEPRIQEIVAGLVDRIADKSEADGFGDLASPLTIGIMCEQLGFGFEEVGDKIAGWAHAYVAQVGALQTREEMQRNAALICELQNYIIARLRERQADPREDMMSDLIAARLEDEEHPTLSFEELVATTRGLINGGSETTATGITHMLFLLAARPDIADRIRARLDDDQQIARFVEEVLRLHPPARALPRMTTREVELGGKRLPAGAHLLMLFGSANDDEKVFDHAREFDMDRKNLGKHLTFGGGVHLCVGMSLARMELKTVVRELLRRLDNIRLAVPAEEIAWQPGISTLTAKALPLTFSRR
jgi:cytochrome P450